MHSLPISHLFASIFFLVHINALAMFFPLQILCHIMPASSVFSFSANSKALGGPRRAQCGPGNAIRLRTSLALASQVGPFCLRLALLVANLTLLFAILAPTSTNLAPMMPQDTHWDPPKVAKALPKHVVFVCVFALQLFR